MLFDHKQSFVPLGTHVVVGDFIEVVIVSCVESVVIGSFFLGVTTCARVDTSIARRVIVSLLLLLWRVVRAAARGRVGSSRTSFCLSGQSGHRIASAWGRACRKSRHSRNCKR